MLFGVLAVGVCGRDQIVCVAGAVVSLHDRPPSLAVGIAVRVHRTAGSHLPARYHWQSQ